MVLVGTLFFNLYFKILVPLAAVLAVLKVARVGDLAHTAWGEIALVLLAPLVAFAAVLAAAALSAAVLAAGAAVKAWADRRRRLAALLRDGA